MGLWTASWDVLFLWETVLRGKKVEKNQKNHEKIENFQIFKIDRNVKIWSNGGQIGPTNRLLCKIVTFLAAACAGRAPSTGEKTYAFSAGGPKKSKKSKKSRKNRIFSNFQNRSNSENLVIWRSVLADKITFLRQFQFSLTGACTGRVRSTGENNYAFSSGKPKTGRYLFAGQRFPWACLREPLLSDQISPSFWVRGRKCHKSFPQ